MKTSITLIALLWCSPAFLCVGSAAGNPAPSPGAAPAPAPQIVGLQVTVTVPPSMRPWISDDIAEAFALRVSDALHQQGYKAKIIYLDSRTAPDPKRPVLAVNLFEWRTDRIGSVNCTFSAVLSSPLGKKDLGLFTGTSLMVFSRRDWLARSDQFEDAATQASGNLYRRLAETHLLN